MPAIKSSGVAWSTCRLGPVSQVPTPPEPLWSVQSRFSSLSVFENTHIDFFLWDKESKDCIVSIKKDPDMMMLSLQSHLHEPKLFAYSTTKLSAANIKIKILGPHPKYCRFEWRKNNITPLSFQRMTVPSEEKKKSWLPLIHILSIFRLWYLVRKLAFHRINNS